MTTLTLTSAAVGKARADAIIIGIYMPPAGSHDAAPSIAHAEALATPSGTGAADVAETIRVTGASGAVGSTTTLPAPASISPARIIAVGLGPEAQCTSERVREAAGAASRAAAGHARVVSLLSQVDVTAAAEGHLLGAYRFTTYRDAGKKPVAAVALSVETANKATRGALDRATIAAESVGLARDFVNTAPNDLPPAEFAVRARQAARAEGLQVQVLTEAALERGGYGGILGVGQGSARPPRLVRISYRPARPHATVALVGKGVTFDSGGISIKPAPSMDNMTSDMAGAAAVIATVIAAARLKLPIGVTATVPMAENLPSGSSYRPGDVLRQRGGTTVHIRNTDAEGRLILADAIVRACEDRPDYLFTAATLTGAQLVALGVRTMGVMGTETLRDRVAELARECGEGGWAMPLPDELRQGLDSPIADIANISNDRFGGMLVAGHYLKHFVTDDVQWAHLDVAGPAFNTSGSYGYTPTGGTGVPVRTLIASLADIAERHRSNR